jgi:hypothetical protein
MHVDISGQDDFERPIKAALRVRPRIGGRSRFFDDVASIYIEWPQGPSSAKVALIAGAFIASLPASARQGTVSAIPVPTWRLKLCGRGNASKYDAQHELRRRGFDLPETAPLDTWEALGIAVVAREEILQAFGHARPA